MFIKDDQINKYFNSRNWTLAHRYYNDNQIDELHILDQTNNYELVGHINDNQPNNPHIKINKQGIIENFFCECKDCNPNTTACGHIGALLLNYNTLNHQDVPYHFSLNKDNKTNYQNTIKTKLSKLGNDLIKQYQDFNNQKFQLFNTNINLIPQVEDYVHYPLVKYKIDSNYSYSLTNLRQFIKQIETNEIKRYGKHLNTNHNINSFTKDAKAYIQFIKYNLSSLHNNQGIIINENNIDDFFTSHLQDLNINLYFTSTDINKLKIKIEDKDDVVMISFDETINPPLIISPNYIYSYQHNILNRYSYNLSKNIIPLLKAIIKTPIAISKDEMSKFHKYIIDPIGQYIEFIGDDISESAPKIINLSAFIDLNQHGELTLNYEYYDDNNQVVDNVEDYLLPLKVESALALIKQEFEYDEITDMYYIFKEADVYDFISNKVNQLNNFCQIYISEDVKNINKPRNAGINIGIRLQNNLLEIDLSSLNVSKNEILDIINSYRTNKQFHRLKNGEFINLKDPQISQLNSMLSDLNVSNKNLKDGLIQVDKSKSLYLNNLDTIYNNLEISHNKQFNDLIKDIKTKKATNKPLLPKYQNILRPYQIEGYNWLTTMTNYGFGGILADDMGLGKTLQIIALVEQNKQEDEVSIVICPATLILNWYDEIKKFTNDLKVVCISGNQKERTSLINKINDYDLVITSYDYIRKDSKLYDAYNFQYIILDEAQHIKNQLSKNAQNVKILKGKHKIALTGTPIENSLAELWSIFDFLMPNYLYTYNHFASNFERPIIKDKDEKLQSRLKNLIEPFILRRTKKQVLDNLPDKIEHNLRIPFNDEENKVYIANLAQINSDLKASLGLNDIDRFKVLTMMTRLRQICCDQRILYPNYQGISSKLAACLNIIKEAKQNNQKVLLFSSFTSVLDLIEPELRKEDISYYVLNGSTNKIKRHQLVNAFQNDETSVFLISLKSGGTGLNLTAASVVIHFDPWWNMSAQNQATDRAYRIGQEKNVQVYKLIMDNSIEEKIQELQEKKQDLSDVFIEGNSGSISSMTTQDIINLFTYK